jgi:predicted O-methyltransferase YrrM
MEPIFTVDWFSDNIPLWSRILSEFQGKDVNALEVGSFQGRASRWLMENILTHPNAKLTCIDTFEGSVEHSPELIQDLRTLFDYNLSPFQEKLNVLVGNSRYVLPKLEQSFDFAYIDGDHRAFAVIEDAIHAFRLLKFGGILIFDDYLWTGGSRDIDNPRIAIDAFLEINKGRYVVLHKAYQLIIRKIVHG